MSLQFLHLELEPAALHVFDQILEDTTSKLKALGDLEQVTETQMIMGPGIDYHPRAAPEEHAAVEGSRRADPPPAVTTSRTPRQD